MVETVDRETKIHAAFRAADYTMAAQRIIEVYGPELLAFLRSLLRTPDEAGDAFQVFCEEMWKSLPRFRGSSSFRTWSYAIARHAAGRQIRSPHRRGERNIPLSRAPEIAAIAEQVRTSTVNYMRTEVKDRVAELRERLDPEERALFVLRLNRKMSWPEIAQIIDGADGSDHRMPDAELKTRAAALRKRFSRAKERLRALVEADPQLSAE